jgi:hypothetical protein
MSLDLDRARRFIDAAPWRTAKRTWHPHSYTVRGQTDRAEFEWFVVAIREHGYDARFGTSAKARTFRYLDLSGMKYWTMGAPLADTVIINRALLDPAQPQQQSLPL